MKFSVFLVIFVAHYASSEDAKMNPIMDFMNVATSEMEKVRCEMYPEEKECEGKVFLAADDNDSEDLNSELQEALVNLLDKICEEYPKLCESLKSSILENTNWVKPLRTMMNDIGVQNEHE